VHVYCAPGRHNLDGADENLPANFVLWTTKDGQPRKKAVLNQEGERVTLFNGSDAEVCASTPVAVRTALLPTSVPMQVAALEVSAQGGKRHMLYELERLQRQGARRVVRCVSHPQGTTAMEHEC
jgi:hypothetical protein